MENIESYNSSGAVIDEIEYILHEESDPLSEKYKEIRRVCEYAQWAYEKLKEFMPPPYVPGYYMHVDNNESHPIIVWHPTEPPEGLWKRVDVL